MKINKKVRLCVFGLLCVAAGIFGLPNPAFAETGISMSPLNQKIVLTPGETYNGSFQVLNGATNDENLKFVVAISPFYMNDEYTPIYENNGDYNQIVDWTTIDVTEGELAPNSSKTVNFSIDVPLDAPAGGQYLSIIVTGGDNGDNSADGMSSMINVKYAMAHIVFAEIAGTTVRRGEIASTDVPSFLFSGNIAGTSTIKNSGNVHSTANYTLQVFPLFSDEEVYTNEEDPEHKIILPDRTLMNTTYWEETPMAGIFKVIYTAEFEGVVSRTEKMVIVCPLWLLFIILLAVFMIIFWLFSRSKSRKKSA